MNREFATRVMDSETEAGHRIFAVDRHFEAMAAILPLRLYEPGYNGGFAPEA